MNEKECNIWLEPAFYRCIPTSGAVDTDGAAIFDVALAHEANARYANLNMDLGRLLSSRGNHVHELRSDLLSFPVKQFQWSGTREDICIRSAHELMDIVGDKLTLLPRPPDYEDGSNWSILAPKLSFLPDNIIIIRLI